MDWLLWIVLGALFIGPMLILVVSVVWLLALIVERVVERRTQNKARWTKR